MINGMGSHRWHANPTTMSVGQPVAPWAHAYDAVCEGADWARNHQSPNIDVAAIQVVAALFVMP